MTADDDAADGRIAIVGMACRFPGAASVSEFRDLLMHGGDAIACVPPSRWDAEAYFAGAAGVVGKTYVRTGGFCAAMENFDNEFFNISRREAETMDPQHRVLLEVARETILSAGKHPRALAGTTTGVFVGISTFDYYERYTPEQRDAFMGTGQTHSCAAGRVAYFFDLKGAAESVDTACSSSLVAVHRACQALRNREVNAALAGGVNAMFSPSAHIMLAQSGTLSPDGHCKTFDDAADGYGRGEGCGMVLLKRLADAERDGDNILAVIAGSAVNHNGRGHGITTPNGLSQRSLIRRALADAGRCIDDVGYIEAHGAGTPLGDPVELRTLARMTGARPQGTRLPVGSVKTNIGHLEAGAGIAGLVKLVLVAQTREIFPLAHLKHSNRHVSLRNWSLTLPATRRPLSRSHPVLAVSAFGLSGTNAHVVLEPAPERAAPPERPAAPVPQLLCVSARSESALRDMMFRLDQYLAETPSVPFAAVAAGLWRADPGHEHRFGCVARDADEARAAMRAFGERREVVDGAFVGVAVRSPKVAFSFTGHGAQFPGMARGLYETDAVFRAALDDVAAAFRPVLDRSLPELLFASPDAKELLRQPQYCQPALFAVEYALAVRLRHAGVNPTALLGHSLGELVAATVAAVMSLSDAAALVCRRGQLMQRTATDAAMLAVTANLPTLVERLGSGFDSDVALAAVNSPGHVVFSGRRGPIEQLQARATDVGIPSQRLAASRAFHSAEMDEILPEFHDCLADIAFRQPRVPIVSNLSGELTDTVDRRYLCDQLRHTVQFRRGLETLRDIGIAAVVEVGPAPILTTFAKHTLGADVAAIPTLTPALDDQDAILRTLAALYTLGVPLIPVKSEQPVIDACSVPVISLTGRRFTADPGPAPLHPALGRHPWLRPRLTSPLPIHQFPCPLGAEQQPMLRGHRVYGLNVLPAAGMIELVAAAYREVTGLDRLTLRDVRFPRPLVVEEAEQAMYLLLSPAAGGPEGSGPTRFTWAVVSLSPTGGGAWIRHAEGDVGPLLEPGLEATPAATMEAALGEAVDIDRVYAMYDRRGMGYSGSFRALQYVRRGAHGSGRSSGSVRGVESGPADRSFLLPPGLLDSCLQLVGVAMATGPAAESDLSFAFLPVGMAAVHIGGPLPDTVVGTAALTFDDRGSASHADLRVVAEDGQPLLRIQEMRLRPVTRQQLADAQGAGGHVPDLRSELLPLDDRARHDRIRQFLVRQLVELLGLDAADATTDRMYFELGLTSLSSMELMYRIRRGLDCEIPSSLILDYECTDSLADQLLAYFKTTIRPGGTPS